MIDRKILRKESVEVNDYCDLFNFEQAIGMSALANVPLMFGVAHKVGYDVSFAARNSYRGA